MQKSPVVASKNIKYRYPSVRGTTERQSYIVEGHPAEQSVNQLVHAPGSRLQGGLLHQHLSGFLQPALQHITHHLHR